MDHTLELGFQDSVEAEQGRLPLLPGMSFQACFVQVQTAPRPTIAHSTTREENTHPFSEASIKQSHREGL